MLWTGIAIALEQVPSPTANWGGQGYPAVSNLQDCRDGRWQISDMRESPSHPLRWALTRRLRVGAGIPREAQDSLFEAFFTTKQPGQSTGLGPYIAYNILVHRREGIIRFESRPGSTCFQVVLPKRKNRSVS